VLVSLIHDLAAYEREPDAVEVNDAMLADVLFADSPVAFATVAEESGEILGMTVHFLNFSTWTGRIGIYLEDFYVRPEHRGRGVGRALLARLARTAAEHGYSRVDWSVLDWNELALGLYRSIGARPMTGWTGYRLDGDALAALGADEGGTVASGSYSADMP
jgi:GNAT superfamily N-acetyltransferase